jgi:UDP-N-acetyl-D-mannosaminuronate dehydrogenase
MAEYAVQRIASLIGSLAHKSVLILGVAYRGNVRETAFSSAKLLQQALIRHRAAVYVDDPLFTGSELRKLGYTPLGSGQKREVSAIILQSNHQTYHALDFNHFENCQVVLDGRQALSKEKIESLGMHYVVIGDGRQAKMELESAVQCADTSLFS